MDSTGYFQARHFGPLGTHLYAIDRRRVVRFPVLGASSRVPPVGILVEDLLRVRFQISRFESLWSEAVGASSLSRQTRTAAWSAETELPPVSRNSGSLSVRRSDRWG